MRRKRRPSQWAKAARCAVSVVLPAPPLREATVMTFMGALPRSGTGRPCRSLVNEWLYGRRALRGDPPLSGEEPISFYGSFRGRGRRVGGDWRRRGRAGQRAFLQQQDGDHRQD